MESKMQSKKVTKLPAIQVLYEEDHTILHIHQYHAAENPVKVFTNCGYPSLEMNLETILYAFKKFI